MTLFSLKIFAQGTITGIVKDSYGEGLPGVNVILKNTANGTSTDFNGKYTLNIPSFPATIVFSSVGFVTKEVNVKSAGTTNIILQEGELLDEVLLIGSRNKNRIAIDTPVPVDVLDIGELTTSAPQVSVNQLLNYAAPSFSSNTQTISDGTDHIDPASLRGLGPDQVLVLINGKRRHKTSLVNVNGTFGRGSVGTDLNSIPSDAIERIEILRDGAAAQYGSDAIAGVINIVLKKKVNELGVSIDTGVNMTNVKDDVTGLSDIKNDGEQYNLGLNYGLPLGDNGGYINFTGSFNFRGATNRMLEWEGNIFNAGNAIEWQAYQNNYNINNLYDENNLDDLKRFANLVPHFDQVTKNNINAAISYDEIFGINDGESSVEGILSSLTRNSQGKITGISGNDVTQVELITRGLQRNDFNMRVGQSELRNAQFFANTAIPVGDNLEIYAFGGLGNRNGEARGFYRLPNQSRTYTPAYINGFLPQIHSTIGDISIATGIRGGVGKWNIDFSNNWGRNSFLYNIRNSSNASMLQSTPFEANAGGYSYAENTANFDMSRFYEDTMAGLNIAFGLEYRTENYNIKAGDEDSYAQFNTNGNIHNPTDPTSIVGTDFFGNNRPGGIQVFPGFKPENEVDENRNSIAAYFDVEADFTENFMTSAAVRFENYSDFGNTTNFKLASRYKINENLSMRGGIQSGFRAPSLHQIHYNSTSTIFVDSTPNELGTFSNTSRVARILGIDPLKEETSLGGSVGITAKIPSLNTKITIDGYMIKIDDRVVYTGSFGDNGNSELANLFAQANATSAAFFANAVDTKTSGIDIVVDNKININDDISFTNTLAFTFSKTDIESINIPSAISNAGLSETYFDKTSRTYIESAVPRTKGNLSHNLKIGDKWNFYLRNSYFGEVTEATNLNVGDSGLTENDFDFGAKIITDLSAGYNISEVAKLTIGTNNLFDIYPDQAAIAFRSSGRFIWSRRSQQFGTNGRYVFARLNFTLK